MPGYPTKSKTFLLILVAFVLGVLVRSFLAVPNLALMGLFIFAGILAALGLRLFRPMMIVYGVLICSAIVGVLRFDFVERARPDLSFIYDRMIYAVGVFWNEPQESANSQLLDVKVDLENAPPILIRVVTRKYPQYFLGEKIKLRGVVMRFRLFQ